MKNRQGFNFYKSYYDVYKEMNAKNRLAFMDALLKKEFENEESELKGMAKFAYLSQKHSIDKQVKGYLDKSKAINKTTPTQGGATTPTEPPSIQGKEEGEVQLEEKGKEEVQISVEFVEPVQLELEPIKKKPAKLVKQKSEVTVFKEKFESIYKATRGLDFYWTAAEATNCKQLIAKIKKSFDDHGFEYTEETALGSFERMMAVDDSWIQDNMSVKILNSKYNKIINSLKNGKKGSSANETKSRRDEINRLLQEKRNKAV